MSNRHMYGWRIVSFRGNDAATHDVIVIGREDSVCDLMAALIEQYKPVGNSHHSVDIPREMISDAERTRTEATLAYFATRNRLEHP